MRNDLIYFLFGRGMFEEKLLIFKIWLIMFWGIGWKILIGMGFLGELKFLVGWELLLEGWVLLEGWEWLGEGELLGGWGWLEGGKLVGGWGLLRGWKLLGGWELLGGGGLVGWWRFLVGRGGKRGSNLVGWRFVVGLRLIVGWVLLVGCWGLFEGIVLLGLLGGLVMGKGFEKSMGFGGDGFGGNDVDVVVWIFFNNYN